MPVAEESVEYFDNMDIFNICLSVLSVGIPCSYAWILMFFAIFHAYANLWGELTRFEDRRFYSDWWNAGDLGEYWRKWNHPIGKWLSRHIYYPLVRRGHDINSARFWTFFISALFHEYIAVGSFRVVNFVAFFFMIVNIPIMIG